MAMTMTENCSSDWNLPLSSLFNAPTKWRRIPPPPPMNLFSKLGDDLLLEILLRLPNPGSSCRCKAVCKLWRSLLSDPSFNRRFISHHRSRYHPAAPFLPADDAHSILSFLPVPDEARRDLRALDCCKDLLLCGFVTEIVYNTELGRSYLVCNPFTKQWIALPLAPIKPVGYFASAAGLVSQPRNYNYNLVEQLGDEPEPALDYSEHRFRVVCISLCGLSILLQVFCLESGEWTQMYLNNCLRDPSTNVVSWKGELFWLHVELTTPPTPTKLAAFNPFRLDKPRNSMSVPFELLDECTNFSVSQGAFHIIVLQVRRRLNGARDALLSVWRLQEDGERWSQQYGMVLKTTQSSLWGDYELKKCYVADLHPEKPEIVYFRYHNPPAADCVLSCNLRTGTGEPECVSPVALKSYETRRSWRVFQPRVSFWPTQIPWYEELRGMYDGSYDCWVQNSSRTTTIGK